MESIVVFGIIDDIPKQKGKILLLHEKNKPAPALYKMPGGTVEEDEAVGRALAREVKEETGLEVIACGEEFYKKNLKNHILIAFRTQYVSG
jgi:8-oxo-dGTP diphosphatase